MHPKDFHWRNHFWCVFQFTSIILTSSITASSVRAYPLNSLPVPQLDPATPQIRSTRLPLTPQPFPLPTSTQQEVLLSEARSLNFATADSLSATTINSSQVPILNPPAPGLPRDERQLTPLHPSVPTTTSLHSPLLESTPQDALCLESTPTGESGTIPNTITIEQFEFIVNHPVFTEEELNSFTRDYLNKALSPTQLLPIATLITKQYAARGYKTSSVSVCIPKSTQQQGKGAVQIRVIEGKLERMDEKPSPSSQEEKESEEAQSFSTSFSFDTNLFSSLPIFQQSIVFNKANLLGRGDDLSVGYTHTDITNDWNVSYTLPLNAHKGTLSFSYIQSEVYEIPEPSSFVPDEAANANEAAHSEESTIASSSPNLQQFGNSSNEGLASRSYELTLRHPIIRSSQEQSSQQQEQQSTTEEFALGLTASLMESSATSSKVPLPFSSWRDDNGLTRTFALRFFQEWKRESAQETIALRSQFSVGFNSFGSDIIQSLAETNQVVPNKQFFSWQGEAQWTRILAKDTVLLVHANAQLANRSLAFSEQFAPGGSSTMRGSLQHFLPGDNGIFASAEVQLPVLRVFRGKGLIQVIPFVDFGTVWNSSGQANPTPNTLASVGLGLQWQQGDFTARLDWGMPLISIDSIDGTGEEKGLYFSVQYKH